MVYKKKSIINYNNNALYVSIKENNGVTSIKIEKINKYYIYIIFIYFIDI